MNVISSTLVTPQGLLQGKAHFASNIAKIAPGSKSAPYILPGFIDTHVHGSGGGDTMDGAASVYVLGKAHLEHGTTTLYPTTITNPWKRVVAALRGVVEVRKERDLNLPDFQGCMSRVRL